jgi:hypothetical protein
MFDGKEVGDLLLSVYMHTADSFNDARTVPISGFYIGVTPPSIYHAHSAAIDVSNIRAESGVDALRLTYDRWQPARHGQQKADRADA